MIAFACKRIFIDHILSLKENNYEINPIKIQYRPIEKFSKDHQQYNILETKSIMKKKIKLVQIL